MRYTCAGINLIYAQENETGTLRGQGQPGTRCEFKDSPAHREFETSLSYIMRKKNEFLKMRLGIFRMTRLQTMLKKKKTQRKSLTQFTLASNLNPAREAPHFEFSSFPAP